LHDGQGQASQPAERRLLLSAWPHYLTPSLPHCVLGASQSAKRQWARLAAFGSIERRLMAFVEFLYLRK
jgi:hypothetical protein